MSNPSEHPSGSPLPDLAAAITAGAVPHGRGDRGLVTADRRVRHARGLARRRASSPAPTGWPGSAASPPARHGTRPRRREHSTSTAVDRRRRSPPEGSPTQGPRPDAHRRAGHRGIPARPRLCTSPLRQVERTASAMAPRRRGSTPESRRPSSANPSTTGGTTTGCSTVTVRMATEPGACSPRRRSSRSWNVPRAASAPGRRRPSRPHVSPPLPTRRDADDSRKPAPRPGTPAPPGASPPSAGLAEAAADADRRPGDPPRREVVVHVDAAVLADDAAAGRAFLEGGPALTPATARRMLCEATVVVMLGEGPGAARGPADGSAAPPRRSSGRCSIATAAAPDPAARRTASSACTHTT